MATGLRAYYLKTSCTMSKKLRTLTPEQQKRAMYATEKVFFESNFTPEERNHDLGVLLAYLATWREGAVPHNGIAVIREYLQFNHILSTGEVR